MTTPFHRTLGIGLLGKELEAFSSAVRAHSLCTTGHSTRLHDIEDYPMNLARMLDEGIRKFGTYDQLFYQGENRERVLSNVDIRERACALASGLKRLGLKKGDVAAVCVSNIPEVPEIINGIMRAACSRSGVEAGRRPGQGGATRRGRRDHLPGPWCYERLLE